MTRPTPPRFLPALLLPLALLACAEEEPQVAAKDRCATDNVKSYLVGQITDEDSETPLQLEGGESTPGTVDQNEVRLQVGSLAPPGQESPEPAILRLFDAESSQNLMHYFSDRTTSGPLILDVVDASEISAGSQGRTILADFDCTLEDNTICVQFGFDSTGDANLHDDDDFAFNATGGTVTILGVDNVARRLDVVLDVELGPNVLAFQDTSSGHINGCIAPEYEVRSDLFWPLK